MKIKNEQALQNLAAKAGKTEAEMSAAIIRELDNLALIDPTDRYCYGKTIMEAFQDDLMVYEITRALVNIGIENVRCDDFADFMDCKLMGDGNCAECGAEMEVVESSAPRCIGGDGYYTQHEWSVSSELKCPVCGHWDIQTAHYLN